MPQAVVSALGSRLHVHQNLQVSTQLLWPPGQAPLATDVLKSRIPSRPQGSLPPKRPAAVAYRLVPSSPKVAKARVGMRTIK